MNNDIKLIDTSVSMTENSDGLLIEKSQYIPDSFIKNLKEQRFESKHRREGEFMHVASVPVAVFENWLSRGIPAWDLSIPEIVALLKKEGLDAFLATDKNIG